MEKQYSYGKFNSISEVAEAFELELSRNPNPVPKIEAFAIPEIYLGLVKASLVDPATFVNETSICESLISPYLKGAAYGTSLLVWSHVEYDIDRDRGLYGFPDYLISPSTKEETMKKPLFCVIEAKKDDYNDAWAQASAAMVAAQISCDIANVEAQTFYGGVSNGRAWEFGKLNGKKLVRYAQGVIAIQEVFECLRWIFLEIEKNYNV